MKENWFIFADVFAEGKVMCVDDSYNLIILDDNYIVSKKINIFKDVHLFDLSQKFVDEETKLSLL